MNLSLLKKAEIIKESIGTFPIFLQSPSLAGMTS